MLLLFACTNPVLVASWYLVVLTYEEDFKMPQSRNFESKKLSLLASHLCHKSDRTNVLNYIIWCLENGKPPLRFIGDLICHKKVFFT